MNKKSEIQRTSTLGTIMWALGILIIGLTLYYMISLGTLTEWTTQDLLVTVVAFATGINSIATGALIDMHAGGKQKNRK